VSIDRPREIGGREIRSGRLRSERRVFEGDSLTSDQRLRRARRIPERGVDTMANRASRASLPEIFLSSNRVPIIDRFAASIELRLIGALGREHCKGYLRTPRESARWTTAAHGRLPGGFSLAGMTGTCKTFQWTPITMGRRFTFIRPAAECLVCI